MEHPDIKYVLQYYNRFEKVKSLVHPSWLRITEYAAGVDDLNTHSEPVLFFYSILINKHCVLQ